MKIHKTSLEGLFILEAVKFEDARGCFLKTFNLDSFKNENLDTDFKEFYYSVSNKNTVRGMHFQKPPFDHTKLVYVSNGSIMDVVLDLRKDSKTYKKYFSVNLNSSEPYYLYIPKGFAHGFMALENSCIVNYAQTTCYNKDCDSGILFNSFGFDWSNNELIISERDLLFESLDSFSTPFL